MGGTNRKEKQANADTPLGLSTAALLEELVRRKHHDAAQKRATAREAWPGEDENTRLAPRLSPDRGYVLHLVQELGDALDEAHKAVDLHEQKILPVLKDEVEGDEPQPGRLSPANRSGIACQLEATIEGISNLCRRVEILTQRVDL